MQYTTNYNLRKPEDNDYYDIADQNANMDTLDSEIKQIENNALTTSSAITYTTPSSYTAPTSGSTIPTLFGRITKGLSDLFTNLAAKLDSSKIIASTNITQSGYVMDGKTCADALTQLNSNLNGYTIKIGSVSGITVPGFTSDGGPGTYQGTIELSDFTEPPAVVFTVRTSANRLGYITTGIRAISTSSCSYVISNNNSGQFTGVALHWVVIGK